MIQALQRAFSIPELKAKIQFTLLMLIVCRIGAFIPVPGINGEVAIQYLRNLTDGEQNLFRMVDTFTGGAFSQMTVIALGVVPYISASIMMQLFVALSPSLQREVRENPTLGRRKVNRLTRFLTLILAFTQATLFAKYAIQMNLDKPGIIMSELLNVQLFGSPFLFYMIMVYHDNRNFVSHVDR